MFVLSLSWQTSIAFGWKTQKETFFCREFLPIQSGFSISHTGGRTWEKSWSFPADQARTGLLLHLYAKMIILPRQARDTKHSTNNDRLPRAQPYDVNFGPGFNVEHGLASAHNRTRLLLSKPVRKTCLF